jgi:hypothetical protein
MLADELVVACTRYREHARFQRIVLSQKKTDILHDQNLGALSPKM